MENIKNRTLYINITKQNKQHEVREARIITLISTFENIIWDGRITEPNPMVSYVKPTDLKLKIAGIGIVGLSDLYSFCGMLYLTEEDACAQTSNYIYKYNFGDFYLRWANIMFNDLNLRNSKFSLVKNGNKSYLNFYAKSWYWDGTKPCGKYFERKFQFDFADNISVEYAGCESENGKFNEQKLYATKETCENDNKSTIVRFDKPIDALEKLCNMDCYEFTNFMRSIGLFGEDEYVDCYNPMGIGEIIDNANNGGYSISIKIEILHDEYIHVKYIDCPYCKTCAVNGLGDDNDEWCEYFQLEKIAQDYKQEIINF